MFGKGDWRVCLKDEELQGGGQRGQSEQHRRAVRQGYVIYDLQPVKDPRLYGERLNGRL